MRVLIVGQGKALAMAELIAKFLETEADMLKRLREMEEPEPMSAEIPKVSSCAAAIDPGGYILVTTDFAGSELRMCALLGDMELAETGLPFGGEFHADKALRDFIDSVAGKLVIPCPRKRYVFVDPAKGSDETAHQTVTKNRQSPVDIKLHGHRAKQEPGDTIKKAPEPVAEEPPIWQLWECDVSTGQEFLRASDTETFVRRLFAALYKKGCDVWLISPDGVKELPDGRKEYPGEPDWVANFITVAGGKFTAWNETQSDSIGIFADRKDAVIAVLKHALELNHRDCDSCGRCESCPHPVELKNLKKSYRNVMVDRDFSIAKTEELRDSNNALAVEVADLKVLNTSLAKSNKELLDEKDRALACNTSQGITIDSYKEEVRQLNSKLDHLDSKYQEALLRLKQQNINVAKLEQEVNRLTELETKILNAVK